MADILTKYGFRSVSPERMLKVFQSSIKQFQGETYLNDIHCLLSRSREDRVRVIINDTLNLCKNDRANTVIYSLPLTAMSDCMVKAHTPNMHTLLFKVHGVNYKFVLIQ